MSLTGGNIPSLSFRATLCHSEFVEESPCSTTHFVRENILCYNLLVSVKALLLSFQILQSLCSLRMTAGVSQNDMIEELQRECFLKTKLHYIVVHNVALADVKFCTFNHLKTVELVNLNGVGVVFVYGEVDFRESLF